MKYYVVIDTNVLVSSMLKWDSVPGNIVNLALNNVLIPLYNKEIIDEYRKVLGREKFGLSNEIIEPVIKAIVDNGVLINETKLDLSFADPKDVVFYEVVMEKKKTDDAYLITGNIKHFPLERFVVTPREMLEIIINDIEK